MKPYPRPHGLGAQIPMKRLPPLVVALLHNKPVYTLAGPFAGRFGLSCSASYDGGLTWVHEQMLGQRVVAGDAAVVEGCGGGSWGPAVAPDGTVVVRSQPDCLFASRDSGATWEPVGKGPSFGGTQMAFDAAGNLYLLSAYWEGPLRLARSRDMGATWDKEWLVQPPAVGTATFPALLAGEAGRVAVAFLGAA